MSFMWWNRIRLPSILYSWPVEESVIFDGCELERGCQVRRAILDKFVRIRAGERVGYDAEEDRAKGYHVSESGITVVPKRPVTRPISVLEL